MFLYPLPSALRVVFVLRADDSSRALASLKREVLGTTTDENSLWERVSQRLSTYEFCVPTLDSFKPYEVGDNNIHKGKVARAGLKKHPNTGKPYLLMHDLDTSLIGDKILEALDRLQRYRFFCSV